MAISSSANSPTPLNAAWQPLGPSHVDSLFYGAISGRVTSIAIDPSDPSGNTVYVGTTGGGVWKSTNAASSDPGSVSFVPLTDNLPVFAYQQEYTTPSLSIGALSVYNGIILAGTGDPNDASDSYYGSGILRSADGGLTWTLATQAVDSSQSHPSFQGESIAGFAWSTLTPNLVVVAVSQAAESGLVNAGNSTYSSKGLFYSTDAGVTWQMSTITDIDQWIQRSQLSGNAAGGLAVTSVVWNPVRQRFYAAVRFHGYYESADGMTWTRLVHQPGSGLSMTACPSLPGTSGSPACPVFRGALAVQPVTGDMFALTTDTGNHDQGLWQDVCGSSSAGAGCMTSSVSFGTQLNSAALEVGNGSSVILQADYNLALNAVATGAGTNSPDTLLYAGTVDLFRCSLGSGCSLRNSTNTVNGCAAPARVAPAQHAIATLPSASGPPLLYVGNDGGLWRSTDGVNQQGSRCSADDASHFQNLNGGLGSLAEVVSFAQDPSDPGVLLAGLGVLGTAGTGAANSFNSWPQLSSGEGGTVAIDPAHPQLWYLSTAAGVSIRSCTSGSGCTSAQVSGAADIGSAQTSHDAALLDAPFLLDPALPSSLIVGTCRVWRGTAASGSSWSSSNAISRAFVGPQNTSCNSNNAFVRSIGAGGQTANSSSAAANLGSKVIYAGMSSFVDPHGVYQAHVFRTTAADIASGNTVWTDVGLSPMTNPDLMNNPFNVGGFDITSVAVDPHDTTGSTVYVTVAGFAGNGINTGKIYRSIDAGAHWTDLSRNLPNSPANSVVVDPNDANTVYIALDTGVWVTTQVAKCTAINCWSLYGTSLPNAPVTQLAVSAALPTGDNRTGELRAATYGRGIWQIPLLTASYPAQPVIALNPFALNFGTQSVSTASAGQTVTVTNTGTAPLLVSQVALSGDFTSTDTCVGVTVPVNSSCTVLVRFVPTETGMRTGAVTVFGNVSGGQASASLSGSGTTPAAVVLNPLAINFGNINVGSTSTVRNVTLSNTGGITAALGKATVSGDFSITFNSCGATLPSQVGCTLSIAFSPTSSGVRSGSLTVLVDSVAQSLPLAGVGTAPATDTVSPLVLTFAPQQLTTSSLGQQITLTNSGDVPLILIDAHIASGDFSVVNACGTSLSAHSTCGLSVSFQPTAVGARSGVLVIADVYRTQQVSLAGYGIAPPGVSLSPSVMPGFPATALGVISAPQVVTLTNNGGLPLSIGSIATSGDFVIAQGGTCGTNLAASGTCTIPIAFAPSAGGLRSGNLTITDNAGNSPNTLSLSGNGLDFSLSPDGGTALTVQNGRNATFPLLLSSSAETSGTATLTCTGAPLNATCFISPSTVPLGSTTVVSVTVNTGVASAAVQAISDPGGAQNARSTHESGRRGRDCTAWVAGVLPLCLWLFPRRSKLRVLLCSLLVCVVFTAGCATGRLIPGSGGTGDGSSGVTQSVTPPGTYNLSISATSGGATKVVNLTLTVH